MENHAQLTARDIHGPFMQLFTNLQSENGHLWLQALNKFLRKESAWPPKEDHIETGPTFLGPAGRVYLERDGRLFSGEGKPLTSIFHKFKNAFPNLEINGKRYFLAKLGACNYIHEISTNGVVTNVSRQIEDPDLSCRHHLENGMGFHEVTFDPVSRVFVGNLGLTRYSIRPGSWNCEYHSENTMRLR